MSPESDAYARDPNGQEIRHFRTEKGYGRCAHCRTVWKLDEISEQHAILLTCPACKATHRTHR